MQHFSDRFETARLSTKRGPSIPQHPLQSQMPSQVPCKLFRDHEYTSVMASIKVSGLKDGHQVSSHVRLQSSVLQRLLDHEPIRSAAIGTHTQFCNAVSQIEALALRLSRSVTVSSSRRSSCTRWCDMSGKSLCKHLAMPGFLAHNHVITECLSPVGSRGCCYMAGEDSFFGLSVPSRISAMNSDISTDPSEWRWRNGMLSSCG